MNLLVLVLSLLFFIVATILYKDYSKSEFNRIYVLLFITVGLFYFTNYIISESPNAEEAWRWIRLLSVSHLIFPLIIDSLLFLSNKHIFNRKSIKFIILYLPFLVLLLLDVFIPELTINMPKKTPYGFVYLNKSEAPVFILYNIIYLTSIFILISLITYIVVNYHDIKRRRYLFFFFFTFMLPFSLYTLSTHFMPSGTDYIIPFLVIAGSISCVFIYFFLKKYRIFDLSPEIATNDIVNSMHNMLFLLDQQFRIININQKTENITGFKLTDIKEMPLYDLFYNNPENNGLDIPANGSEILLRTRTNSYIPVLITVSKINKKGNFLGYVVIGNDLSESKKLVNEKKMMGLELHALQSQMNPHFVCNAINSILHLITEKQEKKATKYLSNLGILTRQVMSNLGKEYVTINEEINLIEKYVELEKMGLGEEFTFSIINNARDMENKNIIPPFFIQPLVENAIKHGLLSLPKQNSKKLKVLFAGNKKGIQIEIEDNGVGYLKVSKNKDYENGHHSVAISNLNERINLYNSYSDNNEIKLFFLDKSTLNKNTTGTLAKLVFQTKLEYAL